ncbi:uncharacterized protein LOC131002895 [Salvia miltiorrhiza]|uniref:uncharacterized protein LOC131002895 n=1 Tax=Salvia miltiorrhiza TaxID=226208 RepID=UPI0025ABBC71|nr:uncharacterized protein LOC131002895 [Salvia miltiorrhiza]
MAAYATLVSAMHIIDNLQLHPCPPIPLHIKQVESLTQKISFLLELLQSYNPHRVYSNEADPLEIRIADAAYAAEYAIESHIFDEECSIVSHIFDEVKNDGENMSFDGLYKALEKVIQDMASVEEEAKQIQGRVGVQHQLLRNSTPPHSLRSSSILQKRSSSLTPQSSMVGADDVKLQMMDKLTSHCRDLLIIPVVGMGGSGPTLIGILPYAGLKFYVYEELKRHVPEEHQKSIVMRLSCGAIAGVLGQTLTYPLDVVRRQMQVLHRLESRLETVVRWPKHQLHQDEMEDGFKF